MLNKFSDIKGKKMISFGQADQPQRMVDEVNKKDIAIIGMSGTFGQAKDLEEFWEILEEGKDCIRPIPEERKKDADAFLRLQGMNVDKLTYHEAGYMESIDQFDPPFFSISPKEASFMDPNQRKMLENVWGTIEDAGYGAQKIRGTRTGVYIGYSSDPLNDYKMMIFAANPAEISTSFAGNLKSVIASRISYLLDLKGPALIVDTSCSSALVAVHLACQAIKNGECEMAIAGGVKINLLTVKGDSISNVGIESSDGRTRTFDHASDGTGMGEGVASILLKPLHKALHDRDHIYAVIKGSAINQDGASIGITAPNVLAQEDVMVKAWKAAAVEPESISYLEAHGTGTKLGDPIEIDGITRAFSKNTSKKQFCAISSVKTNFGHLDHCAGMAGLVKMVLALQHKQVPANVHFQQPNRQIPFEDSPVYVVDRLTDWEVEGVRKGGVSSFGMSGTNSHVVLEEAPKQTIDTPAESVGIRVFTFSAKSEIALNKLIHSYQKSLLSKHCATLDDICFTVNTGRGQYSHRIALLAESKKELTDQLTRLSEVGFSEAQNDRVYVGTHTIVSDQKINKLVTEIYEGEKKSLDLQATELIRCIKSEARQAHHPSLSKLCELYVKGANVDWESFYYGKKYQRVSLPTYPFDKQRCWIPLPSTETETFAETHTDEQFYTLNWKPTDLSVKAKRPTKQGTILIFADERGVSTRLAEHFRQIGRDVILVEFGAHFAARSQNTYQISGSDDDYARLFAAIRSLHVTKLIHLSTMARQSACLNIGDLQQNLKKGIYSLFSIQKAYRLFENQHKIEITLVASHVNRVTGKEPSVYPEHQSYFALGKTIHLENTNLTCRCIDMDEHQPFETILNELEGDPTGAVVAYREGVRYTQEFDHFDAQSDPQPAQQIKEGGVYVITGGTGRLGLEVIKHLTAKHRIHVAIFHRSPLPERTEWRTLFAQGTDLVLGQKLQALLDCEQNGSSISCHQIDVTCENSLRATLQEIREQYGSINGIIHCAGKGVGRGAVSLAEEQMENLQRTLEPKLIGTWLLHKYTLDEPLDFFVLFSSSATLTGGIGTGAYTAANAYLDAFAGYRQQQGQPALTINWPTWAVTAGSAGISEANQLFSFLPTDRGLRAMSRLLGTSHPRIIVGNIRPNMLDLLEITGLGVSQRLKTSITFAEIPPQLAGVETDGYTNTQQTLIKIWTYVLGVQTFSIFDNFNALGGDSILALRLFKEMDKEFPGTVEPSDVFSYPSIALMSDYLDRQMEPENRNAGNVDDLLGRLSKGDLSVEEVAKLMKSAGDLNWN
ncbi:SDR family NAD(P)-dependent oxidoreductase [Brevibacillus antibioticus]|uniref:SDR family NAD(P)-dependent oxidoreductase n=1 Tax=Brevibacillus antibioticus TaxID=2570228 RepID=A0A4U2Y3N0_9BACL|nr:type I polyketide synthase [Brevibacillus antibioticus]TKI55076.1 SDR family NAD(P)-dependent oxidoreductase [Brevibacillus antibioticus]